MFTSIPPFTSQVSCSGEAQGVFDFDLLTKSQDRVPVKRQKLAFRPPFRCVTPIAQNIPPRNHFRLGNWNVALNSQNREESDSQNDIFSVSGQRLYLVTELPERFSPIFKAFRYFNAVQSTVFNDIYNSSKSVVICAPTGSGKTVIMELAIVSLLQKTVTIDENIKIIYMAPLKALCSEKWDDWKQKFEPYGLQCAELTGDTETDDYPTIQKANIIFTTPEKWDSATRRWHNSRNLVEKVKLFLIDEIHVVNDGSRGAAVEAVISRMLTISACNCSDSGLRLIAVSATIPNVEDFATWFESTGKPAVSYKLSDDLRPVKLRKEVIGYYCSDKWTDFKFDLNLNYKLSSVIHTYSDGKPTLVFCSTRKGVVQAATQLSAEFKYRLSVEQKEQLIKMANNSIRDLKLKEVVACGVGYHHAGLEIQDRKAIEHLFISGFLFVLTSTSTLAMGVNMPAHLVIIKSTSNFIAGAYVEYSSTQILQMIGRAGRPQYDKNATAVIMTKESLKVKYENFLSGNEVVESQLNKNFAEYMNAEVVLGTISDLSVAMKWIQSTFFYIRVLNHPEFYGVSASDSSIKDEIEEGLKKMCLKELNSLHDAGIIEMNKNNYRISSTEHGRLMARYCISLDTTKKFLKLQGFETLLELINLISTCKELSDIQLRTSDKKTLNTLNSGKELPTIRYELSGKVRSREMKVNCLIQAAFGCLHIHDLTLNQETMRIFRVSQRLSKFLYEMAYLDSKLGVKVLVACLTVAKCFSAKLWENSVYVSRQLDKIGITMATAIANAGLTTFEKILQANPRQLELIVNRHPPFGNYIREAVADLPKCDVRIEQGEKYLASSADIVVHVILSNHVECKRDGCFQQVVIIGDRDENVVFKQKLCFKNIFRTCNVWSKQLTVVRAKKGDELTVYLINDHYVGFDIIQKFTPKYIKGGTPKASIWNFSKESKVISSQELPSVPEIIDVEVPAGESSSTTDFALRTCNHHCLNKKSCSHECCKTGVVIKSRKPPTQRAKQNKQQKPSEMKNNGSKLRQTTISYTAVKRKKSPKTTPKLHHDLDEPIFVHGETEKTDRKVDLLSKLKKFTYQPTVNHFRSKMELLLQPNFELYLESDFDSSSGDESNAKQFNSGESFHKLNEYKTDEESALLSDDLSLSENKLDDRYNFLSPTNVYQRKLEIKTDVAGYNSKKPRKTFSFHNIKRNPSPVNDESADNKLVEKENAINFEVNKEIAVSTFKELFGDIL